MNKKDENMEWEIEAPYLANLSKTTPYGVPDQYFDDLQVRIQQSIFLENLGQKENQGFTVPTGYFDELSSQIESRVCVEEIRALVKSDGFKTPVNYFEQLQANIIDKTTAKQVKPKVVKLWHTDLMKYASAACILILTASGLYLNQQNAIKELRSNEIAKEQVLYDIDESVIIEHLQESSNASMNNASNTEMENYILDNFSSNDLSNNL